MIEEKNKRTCGVILMLSGAIIILLSILDYLIESNQLQNYVGWSGLILFLIGLFLMKKKFLKKKKHKK